MLSQPLSPSSDRLLEIQRFNASMRFGTLTLWPPPSSPSPQASTLCVLANKDRNDTKAKKKERRGKKDEERKE